MASKAPEVQTHARWSCTPSRGPVRQDSGGDERYPRAWLSLYTSFLSGRLGGQVLWVNATDTHRPSLRPTWTLLVPVEAHKINSAPP